MAFSSQTILPHGRVPSLIVSQLLLHLEWASICMSCTYKLHKDLYLLPKPLTSFPSASPWGNNPAGALFLLLNFLFILSRWKCHSNKSPDSRFKNVTFSHLSFNSGMWLESCEGGFLFLPRIIAIQLFKYLNNLHIGLLRVSPTLPSIQIFPSSVLNQIGEQASARTGAQTSDISVYLNHACQPFLEAS